MSIESVLLGSDQMVEMEFKNFELTSFGLQEVESYRWTVPILTKPEDVVLVTKQIEKIPNLAITMTMFF